MVIYILGHLWWHWGVMCLYIYSTEALCLH